MKLTAVVLLIALTTACTKQRPVKYTTVNPAYDGYILVNENGDRTFLVELKDSTGYVITEGTYDSTDAVFYYPK